MSLTDIINEYTDYEEKNCWKDIFQNAKFDNEAISFTCNIGRHSSNLKYNRYRDILPYDHTRVILNDAGDTDYINANFVECQLAKRRYILAQGPLLTTCEHFWQMVWEQNSKGIIMLNRIFEKGARKCDVYYPNTDEEESDLEMTFGKFQVSYISEQPCEDYIIRKLEVENLDLKQTREIYHCHYINWPDFGEPSDKSFLKFLFVCEELELFNTINQDSSSNSNKLKNGAPVIHCSAGVGRSGTLILIDSVLSLYKIYGNSMPMSVMEVLSELRKGRMGLVQTHQQLRFAFESIIDGIRLLTDDKNAKNDDLSFEKVNATATGSSAVVAAAASSIDRTTNRRTNNSEKKVLRSFSSDDEEEEEFRAKMKRRKQEKQKLLNDLKLKSAAAENVISKPKKAKRSKNDDDDEDDEEDENLINSADDDDTSDSNEYFFAKTDRNVSTVKVNQTRKPAAELIIGSNFNTQENVQNKETKSEMINNPELPKIPNIIPSSTKSSSQTATTNTTTLTTDTISNNIDNSSTIRQRNSGSKNEREARLANLVENMRAKQIDHEKKQLSNANFNKYKPYLVGGGMLLAGILFMKIYKNFINPAAV